ncbi:MAG: DEAD/DEAH box helicase family protein [Bacilli bacterium]
MKLKFIDQQYQTDAVKSIVDIFEGSSIKESLFTIDISKGISDESHLKLEGKGITYDLGYSNKLTLDDMELLNNVRKIQERNGILKSTSINGRNFTVEMETGTGKTYVYIKTILELNKKYGFTKFIIVVPSIAIKEGTYKSLQITEEHFKLKYDNVIYNYFVYDSNKLTDIQNFATSSNIEIMIINIDAFRKSFDDPSKETKSNIIHRASDKLSGNKPIDLIASTNPIVIIDEPQSVDNTPKAKEAIKSLNPLCTLRYSATHKEIYNLMYRLTPVDAYHENLVKHIEVSSIQSDEITAKPYVKLISINDKNGYSAKLEINKKNKDGSISKGVVTARISDDLWELSGEVDYYKDMNYILDDIGVFDDVDFVIFANGETINKGEAIGEINQDAIKRAQIRETIELHLKKEETYLKHGIKVLSLFFIDQVDKYRVYEGNTPKKGQYAIWFEEEFNKLIDGRFKRLKERYSNIISFDPEKVHDGYFSVDGKGKIKNTRGDTIADESTYEKIMRDKEKLLSFKEPLRFIFSHSALKEGWDNPNVFQVCTLVETKDTLTKRQKIGRGLRICVNQNGERVSEPKYNILSVIANESYKDFAGSLQKELETEAGYKFGIVDKVSFSGIEITSQYGVPLTLSQEDSIKIHKYLKENGYLKNNSKVEEKFFIDVQNNTFYLPNEYEEFKDKIILTVKKLSREIEIKNANDKVKVNINKKVFLSDTFKNIWNRISRKTLYSVEMDLDKFKREAIDRIKNMPEIVSEKIERERTRLNISSAGVVKESTTRYGAVGDISEFDTIVYPDFIRRLQDATKLLRTTIINIIKESGRLNDFYLNPESFIKQVSTILNLVKKENLSDGLKYYPSDEYFVQEDIFDDTDLYGYKNKNVIDISDEKNIYDHVIFDSVIEKQFAEDAEEDEDVILYAKLPKRFVVDTPYGNYNPDWIVVIQSNQGDKLYFVAETKGSENTEEFRKRESNKILCGRKHFEVLDTDIKYEVVSRLKSLKVKR